MKSGGRNGRKIKKFREENANHSAVDNDGADRDGVYDE